ncbi:MAG: alpha/beta fold hydrolase [Acidobacteria bacterium]|nr:alpha/beta fold hydrolase [Acidobacteriota bacterium]
MKRKINGINIHYQEEGEGEPLIFIHAFALNQTMWRTQVAAFKHHYRCITLDLRGFGHSDVLDAPSLMHEMASDVRELMKALMIEKAVFVGLSMGGYIALAFYRNYPEAVRALVLADTRATADTEEAQANRLRSAEKALRQGAAAVADETTPKLLGDTSLNTRPDVVKLVHDIQSSNSPTGIAAAQRGMAARADSTDLLAQIKVPTLVLVGSEDKLTPPAEAQFIHQGISASKLVVIENSGHLSNMETPDEFNQALREFLAAL